MGILLKTTNVSFSYLSTSKPDSKEEIKKIKSRKRKFCNLHVMITVYFIWGWKENNLRMFTSVHYIWGRLWTSNHTRTQTFSISFRQRTFIFVLFRDIARSPPWIKLNFFSSFLFISLTVVKLVIMIKIFTSRFKSMFPWLLVMPWCRSKILDQSLSRHHACLVGTGHNKGKEKKKTLLSREWKKKS